MHSGTTKRRPARFGAYELLQPLGEGGMAQLFVARPLNRPDEKVALKRVHEHLSGKARFANMFRDEARVLSLIEHPNVVSAREHGDVDGQQYIVMDYIDGASLHGVMERVASAGRRVPIAHAVRIAGKMLEGLAAAHELTDENGRGLNVVHRDVSPHNVLVGHDGRVRVIDFGIAKARGRIHQTKNNNVKGKLRYMAPEHCGGEKVDRRTDVYSAGIVLWEMLAMRPYFDGRNDLDLVSQVRTPVYRSLIPWNKDVSCALDGVLRRALHPRPARRFQTARAFHKALVAACPHSRSVGPAHVAAFIASLDESSTRVPAVDPLAATCAGAGRRAALNYTFHVVVPKGGHDDRCQETMILGPADRRLRVVSPHGRRGRRRLPLPALFAAAVVLACVLGGAAGAALGHSLAAMDALAPPAWTAAAVKPLRKRGGPVAANDRRDPRGPVGPVVVSFRR